MTRTPANTFAGAAPTEATPSPEARRFLLALGRALHERGVPAHRLEQAMQEVALALGLEAQVYATPTALMVGFRGPERDEMHLQRLAVGQVSLGVMARLDALAQRVVADRLDPRQALRELEQLTGADPGPRPWLSILAFGTASAAAARLFGGGLAEVGAGAVCGIGVGALATLLRHGPRLARLFEPLGAFLVALLAALLAVRLPLDPATTTLAGLIVLVPGLTLTIAVTEVAHGSLVSGSARSFGALLSFLMLGFGAVLGGRLGALLFEPTASTAPVLPGWTSVLAALLAALAFTALLDAEAHDLPWIVLVSLLTWGTAASIGSRFGPELAALTAATVAGATSNLHARLLHRPVMVTRVTALLLLVPGSIGFRGVSLFMSRDTLSGVDAAFAVVTIAVSIVVGLLVANTLVAPRRRL